ncbi:MAG: hypothetical protein ACRCU2_09395 [Planktothrix sp.]
MKKTAVTKGRFSMSVLYAFYCTVFLSTLSTGCFIMGRVFPDSDIPLDIPVISSKLKHFAEYKDEYSVIFIGSSRTYRHIMPDLFDSVVAREGYQIKSFNLGIQSLSLTEAHFYLNKVLDMSPNNLKWVFIEYLDGLVVRSENFSTSREIYWHTWDQSWFVINIILKSDYNLPLKFKAIYSHLIPLMYHLTNTGLGSNFIQQLFLGDYQEKVIDKVNPTGPLRDGFLSLEEEAKTDESYQIRHQDYLNNLDSYEAQVDSLKRQTVPLSPSQPHVLQVLGEMIEKIKEKGAEPIFLIAPGLNKQANLMQAYAEGSVPELFVFNDPSEFPNLYEANKRFDIGHLNEEGAIQYTNLLADRFVLYLKTTENSK